MYLDWFWKELKFIMIEYEDLYNEVKNMLSGKRFEHSEGVVKRAIEYADVYGIDRNTVKLVAIAHDIAKEFSDEENQRAISDYGIELDDIEKNNKNLLHAKIGGYICKEKYGFTEDMVNSVMYHTTGRENMSLLEKIIYLADATDATRAYGDIEYYVGLAKENIDLAMAEVSKWVIGSLLERKHIIHLDSVKCYNYYAKIAY